MLDFLSAGKQREKVQRVIYRSEVAAPRMGVSSIELIEGYAKELKEDKPVYTQLMLVTKALSKGRSKDLVYSKYMDDDILALLKDSIKRSIPTADIFEGYVPYKELGTKTVKSIKKKMYVPLGIFALLVLGLNGTIDNFLIIQESGIISFTTIMNFLMNYFLYVNAAFGAFVGYWLIKKPHKVPVVKDIFLQINGMLSLSTVRTMHSMSYSSVEILKTLMKQFPETKKRSKKLSKTRENIDLMLQFLKDKKFLSDVQSAELKISGKRGEIREGVNIILKEKETEVKDLSQIVDSLVEKVSLVLLGPPILIVVLALVELMIQTTSLASPTAGAI